MFGLLRKSQCDAVLLSAYLDGRLEPRERQAVERHLASCEACRKELSQLRATVGLLHSLPRTLPRRSFTLSEGQVAVAPLARWWQPALRSATAVAAVLLAMVFVGDFLQTSPSGPMMQSGSPLETVAPADKAAVADRDKLRAAAPAAAPEAAPRAPQPTGAPQAAGAVAPQATGAAPAAAPPLAPKPQPAPTPAAEPATGQKALATTPSPAPKALAEAKPPQVVGSGLPFREVEIGLLVLVLALGVTTLVHWRATK